MFQSIQAGMTDLDRHTLQESRGHKRLDEIPSRKCTAAYRNIQQQGEHEKGNKKTATISRTESSPTAALDIATTRVNGSAGLGLQVHFCCRPAKNCRLLQYTGRSAWLILKRGEADRTQRTD